MIEANELPKKEKATSYPCLKIETEGFGIVLFTDPYVGMVIKGSAAVGQIGLKRGDWRESEFELYTGELTLKNA